MTEEKWRAIKQMLGYRVITLRIESGLSQEELADRAGISRANVSHVERGHHAPNLATLVCIARGLGITANELIEGIC